MLNTPDSLGSIALSQCPPRNDPVQWRLVSDSSPYMGVVHPSEHDTDTDVQWAGENNAYGLAFSVTEDGTPLYASFVQRNKNRNSKASSVNTCPLEIKKGMTEAYKWMSELKQPTSLVSLSPVDQSCSANVSYRQRF
jgi:hypothetical protein